MIAIIQIEHLLEAQHARHGIVVDLVGQHCIANGAWPSHVVVRDANQVPGVALIEELRHRSGSEDGNIVRMRLNCSENFPGMRFACDRRAR